MPLPTRLFRGLAMGWVLLFTLLPLSLFAQTPSPSPTPLTIGQADGPLRIDGDLKDWPEARMVVLDRKDQVTLGDHFWKGEDDFNGRAFLTYDPQYLYVAVIIQKTGKIVNSTNDPLSLWNGDCFELFISTRKDLAGPARMTPGDYHIGLSPGTECGNPQVYCFNKNGGIHGSRLVARKTLKGYLLDACIPLSYLEGLDLGPGKTARVGLALDKGGEVSGYRMLQLAYGGKGFKAEDPSTWAPIQWIGNVQQNVPIEQTQDLYANLVEDGTSGATYAGLKSLSGLALDASGKPLKGVRVTTWPKTHEALTDSHGLFQFEKIKIYDTTVLEGHLDGFVNTLSVWNRGGKSVTLRLSPLPEEWQSTYYGVSPFFFGQTIPLKDETHFDAMASSILPLMKPLNPGLICLRIPPGMKPGVGNPILDKFTDLAQQLGAEPLVDVPLEPTNLESAAQWVHHANGEKKTNIRFWAVGDEPERGVPKAENYSAYNYINDFRVVYNAMKEEDPSILILGPETASKSMSGENDWISPLLQYDGDILDGISIHHYASSQTTDPISALKTDLQSDESLVRGIQDKVAQKWSGNLPVAVTSETAWNAPSTLKLQGDKAVTLGFWLALWEADKKGLFLNQGLPLDISVYPWQDSLSGGTFHPQPSYWAQMLWGQMIRGRVIQAQIQSADMSVYATQDLKSRDVTVMILNKGERYWRPKTLLNGQDSDLSVEAGLDQRYEFEIPGFSISLLRFKADKSPGEMKVYNLKMAKTGQPPQSSALKPW